MERIVFMNEDRDIACDNDIIHSEYGAGTRKDMCISDWKVIKPEYYKYTDDDSVLEIWYSNTGMMLSGSIKGFIANSWTDEKREEITYEEAMQILGKQGANYSNKDLMSRIENELERENSCEDNGYIEWGFASSGAKNKNESPAKEQNNGGASDWYALPKNANTLQDLIEHRNMNGSVKDIFKACYRLGIKTEDELRDANKMAYYSLREIGRITGRKDYITIAKELMGSQAVEKE